MPMINLFISNPGNFLNFRKSIFEKLTATITFNGENLNAFYSKIKNKERMPPSPLLFITAQDTSQNNKARKRS